MLVEEPLQREINEQCSSDKAVISLSFEKYAYNPICGEHFVGWDQVSVSSSASMAELIIKIKLHLDPRDEYETFGVMAYNGRWNKVRGVSVLHASIQGNVETVFLHGGYYLQVYLPRFKRGVHDVGVFEENLRGLGGTLLTGGFHHGAASFESIDELNDIITELKGNPSAEFSTFSIEDLSIDKGLLLNLCKYVDKFYLEEHKSGKVPLDDFKIYLEKSDLVRLTDETVVCKLWSTFDGHVDVIVVRRCSVDMKFIPFHKDTSLKTMQVVLNESIDYEGGKLIYIRNNELVIPRRELGDVYVHTSDIIHGVSAVTRGIRYSLFLIQRDVKSSNSIPSN